MICRAAHGFEDFGRSVLERNVQIGEQFPLSHQRDHLVNARIRVDIMEAHPDAEFGQTSAKV